VVVDLLERTRDAFVNETEGLSEAQYGFTPHAGSWSIGEIVEHLALTELRTLDLVTTKLPQAPPRGGEKLPGASRFARLDAVVPNRDVRRVEAPDALRPKGTWPGAAASLAAFVDARNQAIVAAGALGPDALDHVVPHRFFGDFDAEEWLYFIGLHSARHTAQVREIKNAPGYPPA
jgi:hypothetical protein